MANTGPCIQMPRSVVDVYLCLDGQAGKGVSEGLLNLRAHACLQGAVLAKERKKLAVDALPVVVEDHIAQV